VDVMYLRLSRRGDRVAYVEDMDGGQRVVVRDARGQVVGRTPGLPFVQGLAWPPDDEWPWVTVQLPGGATSVEVASPSPRVLARLPGAFVLQDIAADGRALLEQHSWRASTQVGGPAGAPERDLS